MTFQCPQKRLASRSHARWSAGKETLSLYQRPCGSGQTLLSSLWRSSRIRMPRAAACSTTSQRLGRRRVEQEVVVRQGHADRVEAVGGDKVQVSIEGPLPEPVDDCVVALKAKPGEALQREPLAVELQTALERRKDGKPVVRVVTGGVTTGGRDVGRNGSSGDGEHEQLYAANDGHTQQRTGKSEGDNE
eukprot:scaffold55304_cov63-Phaeocystis_antarctica.AAC.1